MSVQKNTLISLQFKGLTTLVRAEDFFFLEEVFIEGTVTEDLSSGNKERRGIRCEKTSRSVNEPNLLRINFASCGSQSYLNCKKELTSKFTEPQVV